MIERTVTTNAGTSYADIRVGDGHGIHQGLADASLAAASRDADLNLPPGLPLLATGGPVTTTGQSIYGIVGPEATKLGATNRYVNMIMTGILNRDMIESNLGRVLSANELSAIATGLPGVKLI